MIRQLYYQEQVMGKLEITGGIAPIASIRPNLFNRKMPTATVTLFRISSC